jgi:hypothetical protein
MDRFQYSRLIDEGVLDEDDPIELSGRPSPREGAAA